MPLRNIRSRLRTVLTIPPRIMPRQQPTSARSQRRSPLHQYALLGWLCVALAACSANPFAPPPSVQKTPIPLRAGGELVLPHSQMLLHLAPLPAPSDLQFNSGDWTLAGGDSASTRAVTLPSCCSQTFPSPLWFASLGVPLLSEPVVGDNHIYALAADGFLHVLDIRTGIEQWRYPVGGELTTNGLALAHGLLYLAIAGHYLAALDANSGQERWRFDTKNEVRAAPFVIGPDVLVADGANSLVCLDALTGTEYWEFHSEDALAQFWPTRATPAYAAGNVYVALGASNEFNALSLRTGRKVWESAVAERMTGGPALDVALGIVYIVTWSGRVVAYDMRTGKLRWHAFIAGGSESSPALSLQNGLLYVGGFDGSLYALDAASGRVVWRANVGSSITTAPLVVQTGGQGWLFVAGQAGSFFMLDAASGQQLRSWQLGELRASPIVAHNIIYQASLGDRGLFALRL